MHEAMQAATSATTQSATTVSTASPLPTLSPSHTFAFGTDISGVALSYDGESLLLVRTRQSIDVWDALTYWWPEISIALALFALLLIGMRVSKRPNALGEPHCRKCGYMLRSLLETRCPECGYERAVERPRFGRRRGWRIAVLMSIALSYIVVLRTGQLRTLRPTFFGWFDWPTDALNNRAMTTMLWLNECRIECSSLARVTIADGKERTLNERIANVRGGPILLAKGETCALSGNDRVALLDTLTGEELHHRRLHKGHGYFHSSTRIRSITAPADGDRFTVWIILNTGSVRKWNLATDESIESVMLKTYDGRGFIDSLASGGRVALPNLAKHEPALLLLDDPAEEYIVKSVRWIGGWPTLSHDGRIAAWADNVEGHATIELHDRTDGSLIRTVEARARPASLTNPLFTPDDRFLIVSHYSGTPEMLVADVSTGEWIASLDTSNVGYAHFTLGSQGKRARIARAGYTATAFVIDVFDLDHVEVGPRP